MTALKLLLLAGLFSTALAQPVKGPGPGGWGVDLQTATAVADQIVVARITGPQAGGMTNFEGTHGAYTLIVTSKLKGDAPSELPAYIKRPDQPGQTQMSSGPGEPIPPARVECLVFLCRSWSPNELPSAIKLAEPTPANLAEVKRFLAPPESASLPVGLQDATTYASRIVVAKITGMTASSKGGPDLIALDVIQSLKGENGGQLTALWIPSMLLRNGGWSTGAKPAIVIPPKTGEVRLIFLNELGPGNPPYVVEFTETTSAQLATVAAIVKNCNLAAQIVLPSDVTLGAAGLKALLRLTNRGDQPRRATGADLHARSG